MEMQARRPIRFDGTSPAGVQASRRVFERDSLIGLRVASLLRFMADRGAGERSAGGTIPVGPGRSHPDSVLIAQENADE